MFPTDVLHYASPTFISQALFVAIPCPCKPDVSIPHGPSYTRDKAPSTRTSEALFEPTNMHACKFSAGMSLLSSSNWRSSLRLTNYTTRDVAAISALSLTLRVALRQGPSFERPPWGLPRFVALREER